ncbi:ATP-grasp domain-containing protein [Streptomyces sp. NPDC049916]|uniref:ATP-grasp domain-containing protein n=1 Tax=Streptomyces sp. NPDC049916 TaxID=3155156 RepID=UPI00343F4D03
MSQGASPADEVVVMEGLDASEGLAALAEVIDTAAFLDRSAFLPASFQPAVPWLRHEPVSPLLRGPLPAPSRPPRRGERAMAVAFAPEHGDHAHRWAARHGHQLLAPPAAITATAADKTAVLPLLAEAGVSVPEYVLVPASGRLPADAYWPDHWDQAVLQRPENNLMGQGTVALHDRGQLSAALDRWAGRPLKVSRLVPGLSLTVTACAAADRTVVSAVSHQLVGMPELTTGWGTHCGNQLVGPDDLSPGLYDQARSRTHAVGEVLRGRGFRGVFGLDLIVEGEKVHVIEINPRFQTVVSLVHAAEAGAGLLPTLGLHILACLLPALPATRRTSRPVPPLSQIVVHAPRTARLDHVPAAGGYTDGPDGFTRTATAPVLNDLPPHAVLLWPHVQPGTVHADDELVLLQTRRRLCPLTDRPALDAPGRSWPERLHTLFLGEAA